MPEVEIQVRMSKGSAPRGLAQLWRVG
jgi:hypothetical protein